LYKKEAVAKVEQPLFFISSKEIKIAAANH